MRIHDGAYGTLLARELRGDETVDDLCLRAPSIVVDAHRAYLDAGADALQTNAFLAHLRSSERRRAELQRAALACAREAAAAADRPVLVLATIGPAGAEPRDFWRDLELVLEAEAPGVLCETVTSRAIADAFLAAWDDVARGVRGVEVMLGCSVAPSRGREAARWVQELAADAPAEVSLGLNCCEGPLGLRPVLDQLCELRESAWAMPSAGLPTEEPGAPPRWPLERAQDWADAVTELVDGLPVTAVGGCCGTTPDAIAALER